MFTLSIPSLGPRRILLLIHCYNIENFRKYMYSNYQHSLSFSISLLEDDGTILVSMREEERVLRSEPYFEEWYFKQSALEICFTIPRLILLHFYFWKNVIKIYSNVTSLDLFSFFRSIFRSYFQAELQFEKYMSYGSFQELIPSRHQSSKWALRHAELHLNSTYWLTRQTRTKIQNFCGKWEFRPFNS